MGSKICMNASCGTTTTLEWKKGWPLRSGAFADLCYRCGSAYENSLFCNTFHLEQSGWRECYICSKRLHCGCIVSKFLVELLDYGGVSCTACVNCIQLNLTRQSENSDGFGALTMRTPGDRQASNVENRIFGNNVDGGRLSQLCQIMEDNEPDLFFQSQRGDTKASLGEDKREELIPHLGEVGTRISKTTLQACGLANFLKPDSSSRSMLEIGDINESLSQPSLSMTLGVSPSGPPFLSGAGEGKEQNNASPSQKLQRSCPVLPIPLKPGGATPLGTSKTVVSQMRMARPPIEGRGKNHLLPRYWPRITDQELQQISGDLNSTIVPLFEKVLSASDAGRIGRLVLPKACAEAYFPPINQSEGIPLRIQDFKGKEWTFQFRFWPNNNSRMYVLEGVTPCIQSMQLQAGDTVTFSRIDPAGKLLLGFRKATNVADQQGLQASSLANGISAGESSFPGVTGSPSAIDGSSGLLPIPKRGKDSQVNGLSEHLSAADGDISWNKNENNGGRMNEDPLPVKEKKRTRNIGSKSKRLLMHNEEAMELRLTWEEAQDLLRPPPSSTPTIVTIEDHEFEEYDEPPVFGKRTIFTSGSFGGQEQWAQCDDCSKWRRLPSDVLLSSKWTCSENVWDGSRCSCSVAEDMSLKELENLLRVGRGSDSKKPRITENQKSALEQEPSGLDALASAAVLGDNVAEPSVGPTTRHPRHRPGCSCIVCIQPPSGKGKHKPTCTCNVCMTVKRRFKTLMLRKKKRQLEREAEVAQKDQNDVQADSEMDGTTGQASEKNHSDNEGSNSRIQTDVGETSTAQIDLNSHPYREDMQQLEENGSSIMRLLQQTARLPCENYMKQKGANEQQPSLVSSSLSQPSRERESEPQEEVLVGWEEHGPERFNEEFQGTKVDNRVVP